MSKHSPVLAI